MKFLKKKIYKIFISSSFDENFELGFEKEREWLRKKIAQNPNFKDISLDVPVAYSGSTTDESLKRVREADIVILFIGSRYGTIRDKTNDLSLTHMEYREAKKHKKVILPYIFPINKKNKDYQKVENFINEVIQDNKAGALYLTKLYKNEFQDVLNLKEGKNIEVDENRINEFCGAFSSELLGHLMDEKDKLDIKNAIIRALLLVLFLTLLISGYLFITRYKAGVKQGIQTVLEKNERYLKLQQQEKILKYKINHSHNAFEVIELNKVLKNIQDQMKLIRHQLTYYNNNNQTAKEKELYNTKGAKFAYEYLKTEKALAEEEFEKNKLIKLFLHKARLAYEANEIDDSFLYYKKILTLSPTYEIYKEYNKKLFFQNKKDKQLKLLQKNFLSQKLDLSSKADIMGDICIDSNSLSYCKKSIKIYEEMENRNDLLNNLYANALGHYALLIGGENKKEAEMYFSIANNVVNDIKNTKLKNLARKLYYFYKAIYEQKMLNYKEALKDMKKCLTFKVNNVVLNFTGKTVYYELLERENEGEKLEKLLLNQIESLKKIVNKYPILYDSYLDYYFQLISFYVSRDSSKAEDKIVEVLHIYKKLAKKRRFINRYIKFLMAYQDYCLEMNRNRLSKKIQNIIGDMYKQFKIKNLNKTTKSKEEKNKHILYLESISSTKLSNSPAKTKELIKETNAIIEKNKNMTTSDKYSIFLHANNYFKISNLYLQNYDEKNANMYAKKALKELNKLIKDDFNLHSIFLIDIYNQILHTETDLDKFEIYKTRLEKIYKKLLQKDRDKFYIKYLISQGNIGEKYLLMNTKNILLDDGEKAKRYLSQSLEGLEKITTENMTRYLPDIIKIYRELILIDREYNNRKNIIVLKQKMHKVKSMLTKVKDKTEFESYKIIKDIGILKLDNKNLNQKMYFKQFRTQGSLFSKFWDYKEYQTNIIKESY